MSGVNSNEAVRVAIYARYSTERQSESSIADQLRVCRDRAVKEGWTVNAEYMDEGISGASLGNRPGAQRLEQAGIDGEFEAVLVTDLSRLSRNQGDLSKLIERLRFRGVRIVGVQDGFDSTSPTARIQAGLSGLMSEELRAGVAARTYSALEMRARLGKPTGGRSYGYNSQRNVVEEEAAIVREVFTRYAAGDTQKSIASDLNARSVPSPGASWKRKTRRTDGRWLVSGVHTLLHNELYVGRLVWNRREWVKDPDTGRRQCRERPRTEWIVHEVPKLAIVDRPTWDRVRARDSAQAVYGSRMARPKYLLSGLLDCGVCGSKFIVMGGEQSRYVCSTHHGGGPHACTNHISVPRDLAEEFLVEPLVKRLLTPEAVEHAVRTIRALAKGDFPRSSSAPTGRSETDRRLAELEGLVTGGVLSAAEAAPAIGRLRAEVEARAAEASAAVRPSEAILFRAAAEYRQTARNVRKALEGRSATDGREALRLTIGGVRLMPHDDGREHYLVAHYQRAKVPLLAWLGTGTGVDSMVAGAGFECTFDPVHLKRWR